MKNWGKVVIKIIFEKKKKPFKQFSKKCLGAMIVLWFIGAVFGFAVVTIQALRGDMAVNLSDLLMYIGAPMTGGIVSYMIKSALEDKNKKENTYENIETEIDKP